MGSLDMKWIAVKAIVSLAVLPHAVKNFSLLFPFLVCHWPLALFEQP